MLIKKSEKDEEEMGNISQLCRVNLKAEASLYTLLSWIVYLPVFIVLKLVEGIKWGITDIPKFVEWFVEKTFVPLFTAIWKCFTLIGFAALEVLKAVIYVARVISKAVDRVYRWINWGVVRSWIRTISILCIIGSVVAIVNGVIHAMSASVVIITGRFYDSNPDVQFIHVMIALLMVSIILYYHAWAYSSPDELKFVCKNTWRCRNIGSDIRKLWNGKS